MNNKQKDTSKFIEDILAQDKFDPADLENAKFKHPILHWLGLNWSIQKLNWELRLASLKGKLKFAAEKFFNKR